METPEEFTTYLHSLQGRLAKVEKEMAGLVSKEHQREELLEEKHGSLRSEMELVRQDTQKVEDELLRIVRQTEKLVGAFKDAARAPQMNRLQQRVDAWKGEQYVSRKEFKKLAEE
ncbi:hypothetical protein GOV07_00135 [Candidatus Woesearchaeota archaeon]|nr:hypothetical protein [Candidatus Woesearchaeota archaeon]